MSGINPSWMYKGQIVYIRAQLVYPEAKETGVKVEVIEPHGNHAVVYHKKTGFKKLMSKWDLWVKA